MFHNRSNVDGVRVVAKAANDRAEGDDLANVALFELPSGNDPISGGTAAPISLDDPALRDAMEHHGLAWFDDTAS